MYYNLSQKYVVPVSSVNSIASKNKSENCIDQPKAQFLCKFDFSDAAEMETFPNLTGSRTQSINYYVRLIKQHDYRFFQRQMLFAIRQCTIE